MGITDDAKGRRLKVDGIVKPPPNACLSASFHGQDRRAVAPTGLQAAVLFLRGALDDAGRMGFSVVIRTPEGRA